jgi:poly-gamma-glutamate synthesis protein (capsule biosynthesis protein)
MPYLSESGDISMAVSGDAMLTQRIRMYREPAFLKLRDIQNEADVALTNLEMTYHEHDEGTPQPETEWTPTCAEPKVLEDLKWFGIDAVGCANNHAFDYGEGGLLANLRNLAAYDIPHAGAGRNLEEARMPCYVSTPRGRVALLSCASSFLWQGRAGPSGPTIHGRPGISYLRHRVSYTAPKSLCDELRRAIEGLGPDIRRRAPNPSGSVPFAFGPGAHPREPLNPIGADTETEVHFLGHRFVQGGAFGMSTQAVEEDIEDICRWIRDARRQSPWTVVTSHTHERGRSRSVPPDFLVAFAHRCIDEGADLFFGHGPHINWGMEIYKGKPIFYSLGNFIYTNNTLSHIAPDAYVRMGMNPWEHTPADFFDEKRGSRFQPTPYPGGYPAEGPNPVPAEGMMAVADFRQKKLREVRLYPLDTRPGTHRSMAGRPMLAEGDTAQAILARMRHLSSLFGVEVQIKGDVGYVRL